MRGTFSFLAAAILLLSAACADPEDELDEPIIVEEDPGPPLIWDMDTTQADSTTFTLDSTGTWTVDEGDAGEEEEYEYEETVEENGIPYERWKEVADDTVELERRHYDEAALKAYLEDPNLDYDRVIHRDNLWWDRFTRWLQRVIDKLFGTKGGQAVWDNIHWVILGIAVVVIAWFFRKYLFGGVFGVAAKRARQVTEIEENIEEIDLGPLLRDAEKARNWRLALRYQWLKVLRRLVDDGLIKWQPRYTDADYLAQLKEPALRATFTELSFLFKWVWYGDAPIDAMRYERMKPTFEAVHSRPTANAPVKGADQPTSTTPGTQAA